MSTTFSIQQGQSLPQAAYVTLIFSTYAIGTGFLVAHQQVPQVVFEWSCEKYSHVPQDCSFIDTYEQIIEEYPLRASKYYRLIAVLSTT